MLRGAKQRRIVGDGQANPSHAQPDARIRKLHHHLGAIASRPSCRLIKVQHHDHQHLCLQLWSNANYSVFLGTKQRALAIIITATVYVKVTWQKLSVLSTMREMRRPPSHEYCQLQMPEQAPDGN